MSIDIPPIIYEDSAIVAFDKPAGLRVIPDGWDKSQPNLREMLKAMNYDYFIVHRLDKDTSGVLILAKDAEIHRALSLSFERRDITKKYFAIVNGLPAFNQSTIDKPLLVNGDRRHRTVIDDETGKRATTEVEVLERFVNFSFLTCRPHSGYTHQIRAHLASIKHPILNDALYFPQAPSHSLPITRLALHAAELIFPHPSSATLMTISSPLPNDFTLTLSQLRQTAA